MGGGQIEPYCYFDQLPPSLMGSGSKGISPASAPAVNNAAGRGVAQRLGMRGTRFFCGLKTVPAALVAPTVDNVVEVGGPAALAATASVTEFGAAAGTASSVKIDPDCELSFLALVLKVLLTFVWLVPLGLQSMHVRAYPL